MTISSDQLRTVVIRVAQDGSIGGRTVQWSPEYREKNMKPMNVDYLLSNVQYYKKASEIVERCIHKVSSLRSKIEERKRRIAAIRAEHDINDAALVELLTAMRKNADQRSFSYSSNSKVGQSNGAEERTIAAGTVNALLTEGDYLDSERAQVDKLELIVRNLKDVPRFSDSGVEIPDRGVLLTESDLKYLGF